MEEDASTSKEVNTEKDEDQFEEESKQIDDEAAWQHSPIHLPPLSPLPPTPPLPSSPRDLNMEQQESEDEGPPPGWDSKPQLKEEVGPTVISAISSDIKMEDLQQDTPNEGGSWSQAPEVVSSDIKVEQEESEDEGPPPGWDSKCQPEPKLKMVCSTNPQLDIKMEDVQQDSRNEDGPQPQSVEEEDDLEDEGPPPGWDSKCQPKPELQVACPITSSSDIKTEDVQQDSRNEDPSPAPELVPSDIKVEQEDSEDEGPPPGWDSKPELQTVPQSGGGMGCEENNVKAVEERVQQSLPPTKPQISAPKPPMVVNNPEMGQMVCGSCQRLLSYPRGARYVECACCLEENYVLEEHEVGQVICGGCNVLLMFPYGALKVRCVNCAAETEIGDQNRRPPLSEHKRRARRHLKRMQSG